jgi:hypothetical protein
MEEFMMRLFVWMIAMIFLSVPFTAAAEDAFDGTKTLLCASIEAIDCEPGEQCEQGLPDRLGAPQFMTIDFAKKEVIGPKRSTPILLMQKSNEQITLQGFELGMGWVFALDRTTGKFSATFAGHKGAFVVFGACTSNP